MAEADAQTGGQYHWSGWTVAGVAHPDLAVARLTETHEYFHRQLDDTTSFGGLVGVYASLALARPDGGWERLRDRLQAMSDVVHETFSVGMSLLTTQRPLDPVDGYPLYDRYVEIIRRLVGEGAHPWVALAALRAAATVCMQSPALASAADVGLERFRAETIPYQDRPNHRLGRLLRTGFRETVEHAHADAARSYADEAWWAGSAGVRLSPESMDGHPALLSRELQHRLFKAAATSLAGGDANVLDEDSHHDDLRRVLAQARMLVPEGLARIGALVESPDADLLHGGALDSQTITLSAAPRRASVLPYGSVSGMSGEGETRHGFLTIARPERLQSFYELNGIPLPAEPAVACLRTTVFNGPVRDSVLLVVVDAPERLQDGDVPIYVSVSSSAAAAAPEITAEWMGYADRSRLSLVMDTPATAALRRWCQSDGARFRTATRQINAHGVDLRIIAGRVEHDGRQSALVTIPTTEFGARWFEAAVHEDPLLKRAVVVDTDLFEEESAHMDVVLTHLILEEPVVGTGKLERVNEDMTVSLSYEDAEALWEHWATDRDDVLARAAFERTLRFAAGLEDEGLYFRPGGWVVDLPATVARVACAAAILAGSFEIAGMHDVEREIIIAAAGLVSTMDLRQVRLSRLDRSLAERIRDRHLTGTPISPAQARKALPRRLRQGISKDQIADALDRLVAAGLADRDGAGAYVVRAAGREAWMRISLHAAPE